jgi:SAM-dependent methyltransferase
MNPSKYNVKVGLKSFIRFAILCKNYPHAALAYFGRIVGHIPGFRYVVNRDINAARSFKEVGRVKKYNIGQITHYKNIQLYLHKKLLFQTNIEEGESLTSEHFFLNRSISDVRSLLKYSKPFLNLTNESLILDPGCGTGRHLHYLVDTIGCKGVGIDMYQPAVNVANKANFEKNISFYCNSSIDKVNIDQYITDNLDLVFINSWLGYVKNDDGFNYFISKIMKCCRFIMIIAPKTDDLHSIFKDSEFAVEYERSSTQYILINNAKVF